MNNNKFIVLCCLIAIVSCLAFQTTDTVLYQAISAFHTYNEVLAYKKNPVLGLTDNEKIIQDNLVKDPVKVVVLLSQEIKPVTISYCFDLFEYLQPNNQQTLDYAKSVSVDFHVIECLALLQGILDTNFVGLCPIDVVIENYDGPGFTKGQNEPFFNFWMSRSTFYLAPLAVQEEIIKKIHTKVSTLRKDDIVVTDIYKAIYKSLFGPMGNDY